MRENESLPPEIKKAEDYINLMNQKLKKKMSNTPEGIPIVYLVPAQTTQIKNNDELDKTIALYTYRTLETLIGIAEFHLNLAKKALNIIDMKNNCNTVGIMYFGFTFFSRLTEPGSPVTLRQLTNQSIQDINSPRYKYTGDIDCSVDPFNKMGRITRADSNPINPTSTVRKKKIGLYIAPERRWHRMPDSGQVRELVPRFNIQVPVHDHLIGTSKNANIINIRWDFESIGETVVRPTLDLTWIGQDDSISYAEKGIYNIAGHHFILDDNISLAETTNILERLNSYIQDANR